jgi:hypothetical protein
MSGSAANGLATAPVFAPERRTMPRGRHLTLLPEKMSRSRSCEEEQDGLQHNPQIKPEGPVLEIP